MNPNENLNSGPAITRRQFFMGLFIALGLGLLARLPYYFESSFPLGDGGLFARIIEQIQKNSFHLPNTIDYNGEAIPFCYPSLGFYIAAILSRLFGWPVLSMVRFLPLALNILTLSLFVLFSRKFCSNKDIFLFSCICFPLIARSYEWLIVGGGITRSLGCLIALSILCIVQSVTSYNWKHVLVLGFLLGMSFSSHLEWGITSSVALMLFLSCQVRKPAKILITGGGIAVCAAVFSSPWWLAAIERHGLVPFLSVGKTGYWDVKDLFGMIESAYIFVVDQNMVVCALSLVGWLVQTSQGKWRLPCWFILIYLTTPRHAPTVTSIPMAILMAEGIYYLQKNFIRGIRKFQGSPSDGKFPLALNKLAFVVIATCLLIVHFDDFQTKQNCHPLTQAELGPMRWIQENIPAHSRFVLLTAPDLWALDRIAEWFPALTGCSNWTTAQGLEWVQGKAFNRRLDFIGQVKSLQLERSDKLINYLDDPTHEFDYLAIFGDLVQTASRPFFFSNKYQMIHWDSGFVLFKRLSTPRPSRGIRGLRSNSFHPPAKKSRTSVIAPINQWR